MNTVIDPGRWEGSVAAARKQQIQLAGRVERQDRLPRNVRWLAGLDVGFEDDGAITRAAAVLLDAETLQPVAQEIAAHGPSWIRQTSLAVGEQREIP